MSQATLLGLCCDNVVTILQPSSTIECFDGVEVFANTLIVEEFATFNGGVLINGGPTDISGAVNITTGPTDISGTVTLNGAVTITNGPTDISGSFTINGSPEAYPPVASILQYAGPTAPAGWLLCLGQPVSRATYSLLFGIIGITFGPGDGLTTFNVPDLRSRIPIGVGQGTGLSPYTLGLTGGVEAVTLDITQIPSHTHGVSGNTGSSATGISANLPEHAHAYFLANGGNLGGTPIGAPTSFAGITIAGTGGVIGSPIPISFSDPSHAHSINLTSAANGSGGSHTNIQPFLALNYIIKY